MHVSGRKTACGTSLFFLYFYPCLVARDNNTLAILNKQTAKNIGTWKAQPGKRHAYKGIRQ
jgi:hypothetical protein